MIRSLLCLSIFLCFQYAAANKPCIPRQYNHSSIVCVCNSTYCDEISKLKALPKGHYEYYFSSQEGDRFTRVKGEFSPNTPKKYSNNNNGNGVFDWLLRLTSTPKAPVVQSTLKVYRDKSYQIINGFGGAFTDAAGINILSLTAPTSENLLKTYFSENGIEYNTGRVPIGGCDFSTHPYAYNMYPENDVHLSNFSLADEDYQYKIPLIQQAQALATDDIYLIGSAWSPPIWMKTNNNYGGLSRLLTQYYQTWADYHIRFLDAYHMNDISFWAVTTGNEPSNGIIPVMGFNSLGWMPREQAVWVANNLGPSLRASKFGDVNILALDDQRFSIPWWIEWMSENQNTMQYINGIATHWYWDRLIPANVINTTHITFPNKFLISTEACVGDKPWETEKVELGSWSRAELYIDNIIEDLNNWYTGWTDWNLALDRRGGPNWFNNFVDSPIIVIPENDEFLKQPLFYSMGHFSKFIPRGSKRIFVDTTKGDIKNVAFLRPDNGVVVIFYNPNDFDRKVTIYESGRGYISIDVPRRSVHSVVYW